MAFYFQTRWIAVTVGAFISGAGCSDAWDNGWEALPDEEQSGENSEEEQDRDCLHERLEEGKNIDLDTFDCLADVLTEDQLDDCFDAQEQASKQATEAFRDCYPSGGCIDQWNRCGVECLKKHNGDDDDDDDDSEACLENCDEAFDDCADWVDYPCVTDCFAERDDCVLGEIDNSEFQAIDWDYLDECLVDYESCFNRCFD